MAIMSSRLIRHQICIEELRKLGAKVISIQGIMFYVKFKIKDTKLSYMYHIKTDNTYYLERIKPYFMTIGDFQSEEDIIDVIKIDLEQFTNAMNSKNFNNFIQIDKSITKLVRYFEDLFLYYNVSKDDLNTIQDEVDLLLNKIIEIKNKSKRVYYKKDPDVLK
ncbi:hypothetical protein [Paramaledivibacter caminithermalis]|jgi:hypothetical protein|uniref:Uncharacterized protein n=1 Tax=Paramaledivibacter caminithermalis (strain DSM 15212 / CIP 107654 / DViRD3) TaxID=1121301 RepID=A0A1M6SZF6_PARC5|nr:hypothetical protein [Paramaledivibacter caminithermalis]SHK49999.1 hypothetical protein SAMN02745912_03496 [Paramaledivibacter caminithermalis DSM 15212]